MKGMAGLAAAFVHAKPECATNLFGAATTLMSAADLSIEPVFRPDLDRCITAVRARLGGRAFADAWAQGSKMTLEQAVEYASALTETSPLRSKEPEKLRTEKQDKLLTSREREIATLVAGGLTNREIAGRLVISQRTTDAHLRNILNKLGVTSRAEIAAWAVECGLYTPPMR
jgi:non-specific serine/threonine protein kinase